MKMATVRRSVFVSHGNYRTINSGGLELAGASISRIERGGAVGTGAPGLAAMIWRALLSSARLGYPFFLWFQQTQCFSSGIDTLINNAILLSATSALGR